MNYITISNHSNHSFSCPSTACFADETLKILDIIFGLILLSIMERKRRIKYKYDLNT